MEEKHFFWEVWNNSPEGQEWGQKFMKTEKFVERMIFEVDE